MIRGWSPLFLSVILTLQAGAQSPAPTTIVLDSFDSISQWTATPADGVETSVHPDSNGVHGRAMRVDFDFHGHGGYAVIHRPLTLTLPSNYEFSFAIKADAPTNTLEFKMIDSTVVEYAQFPISKGLADHNAQKTADLFCVGSNQR